MTFSTTVNSSKQQQQAYTDDGFRSWVVFDGRLRFDEPTDGGQFGSDVFSTGSLLIPNVHVGTYLISQFQHAGRR